MGNFLTFIILIATFALSMGIHTSTEQRPTLPTDERPKLVMLGDSTLDNIVWVGAQENSIKYLLQKLNPNRCVVNLAADGFTSQNVLSGLFPSISYQERKNVDPYPILKGQSFKPLQALKSVENVEHIVLSIGGNDIRTILSNMGQIQKASAVFLSNYFKICQILLKKTPKVVLMMQYKPSTKQTNYKIYQALSQLPLPGTPMDKMNHIMETIYPKVFDIARQYNLPLIDLPNSFDPEDEGLYKSQIEPSKKGGECISKLITHVVNTHDYKSSLFYYCKNGQIKTMENNGNWKASL